VCWVTRGKQDEAVSLVDSGGYCVEVTDHTAGFALAEMQLGLKALFQCCGDARLAETGFAQAIVGETPNLAARLQVLAARDAVVIAATTRRLVGDLFEYRDLGAVEVKGIAEPVPAWQVLRPTAVASRFEALRGAALTRLVGRDEEIDLLMQRWARAKAGDGQVVLVSLFLS
jgi:hypothetical protein